MGVATGCGCKEVYRFTHTTYLVSVLFAAASLLFVYFVKCFSFLLYGMGHKKVSVSCFFKSRFLAVQRKRNVCNTARSVPR